MNPSLYGTLRRNLGTWAASEAQSPRVAGVMLNLLPRESFDPAFGGQHLRTTYFDTLAYDLRKARRKGDRYLTLRLRGYGSADGGATQYALSAKTEKEKLRYPLDARHAQSILAGEYLRWTEDLLPGDMQARLLELAGDATLYPVVCVHAHRYAVEDDQDRITLDVAVRTDTGKRLPFHVVEFKSAKKDEAPPGPLIALGLRPIKSSKFLWATNTEG
jgi:hypothetical protein